jgi:putative acetyltransferase
VNIRPERPDDVDGIDELNRRAFDGDVEANLVRALRDRAQPIVSLVAAVNDNGTERVIGHILFSPVTLSSHPDVRIMGLAPMAVLPAKQRCGVGSALVHAGLDECRRLGYPAVVVLGHAGYYPRFGFVPASRFRLGSEYDVPDEVFMAIELEAGALAGKAGVIRYHPAFASA